MWRSKLEIDSEKFRRGEFNYGDAPIGENIFKIIEQKLNVNIVKRPIKDDNPGAFILKSGENTTIFINSNLYLDKQIFAAAHELYHYFYDIKGVSINKTVVSSQITQDESLIKSKSERNANYFAAVFLVPSTAIKDRIDQYPTKFPIDQILYDVLNLQVEFAVPYKTIVKRLKELNYINENQYTILMRYLPRDQNEPVYKLAKQIGESFFQSFRRLNHRSEEIYFTDAPFLKAVANYNHGKISYNKLLSILHLYNRSPEEFDLLKPEDRIADIILDLEEGDDC